LNVGNTQQVLVPLLLEYRSRHMYNAIAALWRLHGDHPDDFVSVYRGRAQPDALHYHRRIVSHFYGLLAGLYSLGVVPANTLYSYWSQHDLRIIPSIILPIERELRTSVGGAVAGKPRWEEMLQRLYDDAPK
jgi:hypothetical protein